MITQERFEAEYRKNNVRVVRMIQGRVPTLAIAEEIAAQAWLNAWKARAQYNSARGAAVALWVTRIAINLANGYWRDRDSRQTVYVEDHLAEVAAVMVAEPKIDTALDAVTLLSRVENEKALAILQMQYIDGMEVQAIADEIGDKVNTVKVIAFRARAKLRKIAAA